MDETKEDGELSGSDFEEGVLYTPVERADPTVYRNIAAQAISEDDSSDSSDSDSDCGLPKRKKFHFEDPKMNSSLQSHPNEKNSRRKNNIWSNILQEEGLMQDIGGVGLKKINNERSVESYDYTQALRLQGKYNSDPEEDQDDEEDIVDKRDADGIHERLALPNNSDRKRKREKHKKERARYLKEIEVDPDWTDEQLGIVIADALFESKPELLVKCVEVLGKKKAFDLYIETQRIEKEGGIMVLNGSRRRTSGGVYLNLLKSFNGVGREDLDKIFMNENKEQSRKKKKALRKMNRKQCSNFDNTNAMEDEGLHIRGLFSDDPGGTKCPGSTPVTSPQDSGSDEDAQKPSGFQSPPLPLKEVFERAAFEVEEREVRSRRQAEEMDVV